MNLKPILVIIIIITCHVSVFAQQKILKQPKGFVYVKTSNTENAFYVKKEPVTKKEFAKFIKWTKSRDLNKYNTSLKTTLANSKGKYICVTDTVVINLYRRYLTHKYNTEDYVYAYRLPTKAELEKTDNLKLLKHKKPIESEYILNNNLLFEPTNTEKKQHNFRYVATFIIVN